MRFFRFKRHPLDSRYFWLIVNLILGAANFHLFLMHYRQHESVLAAFSFLAFMATLLPVYQAVRYGLDRWLDGIYRRRYAKEVAQLEKLVAELRHIQDRIAAHANRQSPNNNKKDVD